jgi:serine protease inhibitor
MKGTIAVSRTPNRTTRRNLAHALWPVLACALLLRPMPVTAQLQPLVDGNTAFALNFYKQVATNQGNLFFSPYSISTCFAMTYAGAAGNTEAQMSEVLGFSTNQQQLAATFDELQSDLEATEATNSIELNIANALWTQEGFPFLPSFLDTASNDYQANINQADFATEAAEVTAEINAWVAQETQNKIQNILGSLSPSTVMVLANAIYFRGVWTEAFAVSNTTSQPFYLPNNGSVTVPMMYQPPSTAPSNGMDFNYMENDSFQALELPYGTNQTSMIILLPWDIDGLAQLVQQLSPAFLSNVLAEMSPQSVEIYLPKFTITSFFDLTPTLAAMGMPAPFTPFVADFSGIDGSDDLYLSVAYHKAWVQVDEAGTEAAAATVNEIVPTIAGQQPQLFQANQPFLFLIRDTKTGSILFMGQVTNPVLTGVAPTLAMVVASGSKALKISWPYPSSGWSLLQTSDLGGTNWVTTSGVSNDGTNNSITIKPSTGSMFFRLSQ